MAGFPQYIYDPIHELIRFEDSETDRLLMNLIDTKEFQRLRRIKQLGMTSLVFPGANHNRFSHCLGVMHLSRSFLDRMERVDGKQLPEQHRAVVLAAALLHDVGHGPFSHVFEKVSGDDHEQRTGEVILTAGTEVHDRLAEFDEGFPGLVAQFFQEDPGDTNGAAIPPYLTQIVSSQMDADRFDYLMRDSHFTGVNYGKFDYKWLIEHLEFDDDHHAVLTHKAFEAAETYVFARYHMYRAVYFHKTTRSAEIMLRTLFKRYKERLDAGADSQTLVPDAPLEVVSAFKGGLDLNGYLDLDDDTVTVFLRKCGDSPDAVLSSLGKGLLHRRLWKCIDLSNALTKGAAVTEKVLEVIESMGLAAEKDFYWSVDTPADTPYKPYSPTVDAVPIVVRQRSGEPEELTKISKPVEQLKKYEFMRYYFPDEVHEKVVEAVKNVL